MPEALALMTMPVIVTPDWSIFTLLPPTLSSMPCIPSTVTLPAPVFLMVMFPVEASSV